MHLKIFLHAEGDGFTVSHFNSSYQLTQEDANEIHPLIGKMFSANTREEITKVLKEFKNETKNKGTSFDFWQSVIYVIESDGKEDIKITLLHENAAAYRGHTALPGRLHSDSIEKMIRFTEGSDRDLACTLF